ncbi:MAG: ATP-binding protein, partial [Rhodomicrobium sp.]
MTTKTTTATVNAANAYRQIITNFSNPLEFVREAVSNSIDAAATSLSITVEQATGPTGQPEIRIVIKDDGKGMNEEALQRFFNLGDSQKSALKDDANGESAIADLIGEKGFGTKIYLNSRRVEVRTKDKESGVVLKAISQGHLERIHEGLSPQYDATQQANGPSGTEIKIFGYNHNDGSKLGHDQLRDYILWFTKFGSIEALLWATFPRYSSAKGRLDGLRLDLCGLGFDPLKHAGDASAKAETLHFGHVFPDECFDGKALRAKAKAKKAYPTDFYCRRFVKEGVLRGFPGQRWQAVFSIEGNRVKYENPMVRRQGYKAPQGAYKVAERYGIWVCKDFIPAERVNVLLPGKGSEFLKFHSFFNCQAIQLSADRTSIGPTPPVIRAAIEEQILGLAREIFEDEGVAALLESLDEEEFGERTEEQEKKDYARRVKQAK